MKITTVSVCVVCGILPLMILPVLPDTWILAVLFCLACLLCLIPHHYARYAALTLLFFMWGIFAARQAIWAGNVLPAATQEATVVITATDHMTTHYGRITHLRGKPLFPAVGIVLHGQYLPTEVCAGQQWAMTLKVRAVHGQLNEGGFDSQRYALAQHQPLTGRFLQAKAINPECSLRGRYLASLRATLAPYPWQQVILALGMGERGAVSQEVKTVMRDTGTAHLMAISGLHIAFAALLAAGLIRGGQFFLPVRWIRWQTPLLGGILCAICYAWLTGLQPPAHGGGAERLGRIKIKRTTVERLASLVLLYGRDYFRRSCGGYITKSLAVSICGCRPVILVSVVSCAKRKFSTGLTLVA